MLGDGSSSSPYKTVTDRHAVTSFGPKSMSKNNPGLPR